MKIKSDIVVIVMAALFGVLVYAGVKGCYSDMNTYKINNQNFNSNSRFISGYISGKKIEYTKLKDGSEEILVHDINNTIIRYQNLDGDYFTIDRIRIDKTRTGPRDSFKLEDILIRKSDYSANQQIFDEADKLLAEERRRYSK